MLVTSGTESGMTDGATADELGRVVVELVVVRLVAGAMVARVVEVIASTSGSTKATDDVVDAGAEVVPGATATTGDDVTSASTASWDDAAHASVITNGTIATRRQAPRCIRGHW